MKEKETKLGLEKIIIILLSGMLLAAIATGIYFAVEKTKIEQEQNKECECEKNKKITSLGYTKSGGLLPEGFEAVLYQSVLKENASGNMYLSVSTNYDDSDFEKIVDNNFMEAVEALIDKYKVNSWAGFNESDERIADGISFSLKIEYSDGETVEAFGYEKYPTNYEAFVNEFLNLINNK